MPRKHKANKRVVNVNLFEQCACGVSLDVHWQVTKKTKKVPRDIEATGADYEAAHVGKGHRIVAANIAFSCDQRSEGD